MKANLRSLDGLLRICYNLPHRIHTSKVYPLSSPNGSTIIVYGHEQGLRILWRGGRPLRDDDKVTQEKPKSNGANNDAIMILDSSDEEPSNDATSQEVPTFQDEGEEYDPSEPYDYIVQTLDLPLGVEVLHLSFPRLPPDLHRSSLPRLVSNNVLMAVACADYSIRLISIPLLPPSPQSLAKAGLKENIANLSVGKSLLGEQMIVLSSGTIHQSLPKGVSIALTADSLEDSEDVNMANAGDNNAKLPSSQRTSRSLSRSRLAENLTWDLLVASHSADLSGRLLIHRIPLEAEGTRLSTELHIPWQQQYLASSAVSVEFSSAIYPAQQHSQLLVAEVKGSVRIFDCLPKPTATQGPWLVSLYTEFESPPNAMLRRKPILDARWILGGKGILVLQTDGKWGIWNHEGRGPSSQQAPPSPQSKPEGRLTTFALQGWVGTSLKSEPIIRRPSIKDESPSKLAPMTPSTRKMKQDALFSGPTTTNNASDRPPRGGISVTPTNDSSNSKADDESILLWHGTTAMTIPSLFTHWQNKIRGSGNLFGSGAKGEPKTINNIQLGGELCNEIDLIPNRSKGLPDYPQILVTGEKRLLIIAPPLPAPEAEVSATSLPISSTTDQLLLDQGELDVDGMDRIMAGMSNGRSTRRNSKASSQRSLISI